MKLRAESCSVAQVHTVIWLLKMASMSQQLNQLQQMYSYIYAKI